MKAILVTDMPKICRECLLRRGLFCGVNGKDLYGFYTKGIADWCPLKPLPQKLDEMSNIDSALFCQNMKGDQFCIGWNECLEEIEK